VAPPSEMRLRYSQGKEKGNGVLSQMPIVWGKKDGEVLITSARSWKNAMKVGEKKEGEKGEGGGGKLFVHSSSYIGRKGGIWKNKKTG